MGFVEALVKPAEDNEAELRKLALDMTVSFSRMRYAEKLTPAALRAHHIDPEMGESVSRAIVKLDQTARQYQQGAIDSGAAARNFEMGVPGLMNFLIHEVMDGGEGNLRTLPPEIEEALHAYYDKPTMDNARHLVGLAVQNRDINAHWLFDNLARAVIFCDDVNHRQTGRS